MKKFKGLLTLTMAILMIAGMMPMVSFAADGDTSELEVYADVLNALGIFRGTTNGYELEGIPNRVQASVMLVRLLGKEEAALVCTEPHPFTDVPDWAQGYVAYMYANGLTQGMSDTLFGSDTVCDGKMYATFVLRALSFNDAMGDFSYDNAITFGRMQSLLTGEDALRYAEKGFTRGDMALMSYNALFVNVNNSDHMLLQKLHQENAVEPVTARKIIDIVEAEDLLAWASYNTLYNVNDFDYKEKWQSSLSVAGYSSQSVTIDTQAKGTDLSSNPTVAYRYVYSFPDGQSAIISYYIANGYEYTNREGTKTKAKYDPLSDYEEDDTDTDINTESNTAVSILDRYPGLEVTKGANGMTTITITYDPSAPEIQSKIKDYVGMWVDLSSMKDSQYEILCTKYVKTYTINADMEFVTEEELAEISYIEDGDPLVYKFTGTKKRTYNNVGEPVTVELPDDLDEYVMS